MKREWQIFFAVLLGLFAVYNAVWFAYREIRYKPLTENIENRYGVYLTAIDDVTYSVSKPSYLSFTGNLSLADTETHEGLIIWPEFPSGYRYAADIAVRTDKEDGREIPVLAPIMIDENGNWIDDSGYYGKKEREIFDEKQEEIKEWLENKNQLWVEDSTNKEASYTRNKIRQNILPQLKGLNEKAVLHLANAAETFLMAEEYIGRNADMMYNRYVICKKDRTIIKQGLFQEDRLMQSYVIQRAVSETAGKKKDIGMLHVKLIQELEKKQSGSRISLIYGITVWQNYGDICLIKGELEKKSEIELKMEVISL